MASNPSVRELAKQCHPKALILYLNSNLKDQEFTVIKCGKKDDCLNLAVQIENDDNSVTPKEVVDLIEHELIELNPTSITKISIYGKTIDQEKFAWKKELILKQESDNQDFLSSNGTLSASTSQATKESKVMNQQSLKQQASLGNAEAIQTLLDIALSHKEISSKTNLENKELRIVLEAANIPDQDISIQIIQRQLTYLQLDWLEKVIIYGKKTGHDIPAWDKTIKFDNNNNNDLELNNKINYIKNISNQAISKYLTQQNLEALIKFSKAKENRKYLMTGTFLIVGALIFSIFNSYTISGDLTLIDSDISGSEDNCYGTGGYGDIEAFMPVTIKNKKGEIIATSQTSRGKQPQDSDFGSIQCVFTFEVKVPKSEFYTIEIGRRGGINYSFDEMKNRDWEVSLSIGL